MEIIYEVSPFFTKLKMLFFIIPLCFGILWVLSAPFQDEYKSIMKWPVYIILIPFLFILYIFSVDWRVLNERYESYLSGEMQQIEGRLKSSEVTLMRGLAKDLEVTYRVEINLFTSQSGEDFYFNRVSPKTKSGGEGCLDMLLSQNIEDYYGKKMSITFLPIPSDTLKEPIKCIFKIEVEA